MKVCSKCNKTFSDEKAFCDTCGTKLSSEKKENADVNAGSAGKKNSKRLMIALPIAACAAVILIIAMVSNASRSRRSSYVSHYDSGADRDDSYSSNKDGYSSGTDIEKEYSEDTRDTDDGNAADDGSAAGGESAAASSGEKVLVFDPLDSDPLTYTVDSASVYIQNPKDYFGTDLTFKDKDTSGDYIVWDFRGDYQIIKDYVDELCSGDYNLKLADKYYESYPAGSISRAQTFFAWLIDYTGSGNVRQETTVPFIDDETATIGIYGLSEGSGAPEIHLWFPKDMEAVDLGLRHSGGSITPQTGGASASAGLYRMPDGSFETTDGRLSTTLGEAMILRDGEVCTTSASMHWKDSTYELWIQYFNRDDTIYFSAPHESFRPGDVCTKEDILSGAWWADNSTMLNVGSWEGFDSYNWPLCLGAAHNGDYILPSYLEQNEFTQILVRMLYQTDAEEVYYIYVSFDSAPYEYEALCAFDKTKKVDATTQPSGGSSGSGFCSACGGDGKCRECGGTGKVRRLLAGTTEWVEQTCTSCYIAGNGKCRDCRGTGEK